VRLGGDTVDTNSATGKLILAIFAGFAQFEREIMLERQREGNAKAKTENRYLGRRPTTRLKADEAVKLIKEGTTVTEVARALGIGRGSVYRALQGAGAVSEWYIYGTSQRGGCGGSAIAQQQTKVAPGKEVALSTRGTKRIVARPK
jgi:DNA invertase Pin-like site-specific DNA recombinase